ncbi:ankyrin-1-like [Trichogramma pretiosum]|uniref:ankyrin-1-like n=1 Tax=Trichogramma pretiosum TaxID=7493 RepID=UPI000C718B6C|nr:ankyrin-1-like [Trichogramma pretiosum]
MTNEKVDVYYSNGSDGGLYNLEYEINNHVTIVSNLRKMKKLREKVIGEMEKGQKSTEKSRVNLFKELGPLINNWKGQYPDLGKLLRHKEMDWLLMKYVEFIEMNKVIKTNLLSFVIECGYKGKPEIDKDNKALLRRTTPLHHAARSNKSYVISDLCKIYDRFNVDYIDEGGYTPFHVACRDGCYDVVEKFLELGQDPNCPLQKSVDPPLHLALYHKHQNVAELLLKNGANPNLATEDGCTPLHLICARECDDDLAELFFKMCDDSNHRLQIDARNKWDQTPLHVAVFYSNKKRNNDDSTHLMDTLFSICDDRHQLVQVDTKDKSGWTPLQWAVAYLHPNLVDVLLDHGAKLSNFVFPKMSHFNLGFVSMFDETAVHAKLKVVFDLRTVVKCLEKRDYKLKLEDLQTIKRLFDKYEAFKKLPNLDQRWYDKEEFSSEAKNIEMSPNQSLYDLVRSPPAKAEEILPNEDYYHKLVSSTEWSKLSEECRIASVAQLCEIMARGFLYKRRALASLVKLTRNKLPIFCYDMIIEPLTNKDLWHICLASPRETRRSL